VTTENPSPSGLKPSLPYLSAVHKSAYDAAASEYEARVASLLPVTEEAVRQLALALAPGASVLDVGCGAGLAIQVMTAAGFAAEGIELSPKMAKVARRRNPGSRIITGDLLTSNLGRNYDAVLAFAFIHLFPKADVPQVLARIKQILVPQGVFYVGTTQENISSEGFEEKSDYANSPPRWRSRYVAGELVTYLVAAGFEVQSSKLHVDAFGKRWHDYIVTRDDSSRI
jgi:cyclopropane fatty-acyl-phospholipid synthase-like methyltransferase